MQKARIVSSVVFQDSDTHIPSVNLDTITETELRRRLLSADPKQDALRALTILDWRLVGISADLGATIPGFQPIYATMKNSTRLKLIAFPPGKEFQKRAELYCLDYNATILQHLTGKETPFSNP